MLSSKVDSLSDAHLGGRDADLHTRGLVAVAQGTPCRSRAGIRHPRPGSASRRPFPAGAAPSRPTDTTGIHHQASNASVPAPEKRQPTGRRRSGTRVGPSPRSTPEWRQTLGARHGGRPWARGQEVLPGGRLHPAPGRGCSPRLRPRAGRGCGWPRQAGPRGPSPARSGWWPGRRAEPRRSARAAAGIPSGRRRLDASGVTCSNWMTGTPSTVFFTARNGSGMGAPEQRRQAEGDVVGGDGRVGRRVHLLHQLELTVRPGPEPRRRRACRPAHGAASPPPSLPLRPRRGGPGPPGRAWRRGCPRWRSRGAPPPRTGAAPPPRSPGGPGTRRRARSERARASPTRPGRLRRSASAAADEPERTAGPGYRGGWAARCSAMPDGGEEGDHQGNRDRAPHPRRGPLHVEQLEVEEGLSLHDRDQRLHRAAEARPRPARRRPAPPPVPSRSSASPRPRAGRARASPAGERGDVSWTERLERAGWRRLDHLAALPGLDQRAKQRLVVRRAHRGDTSHPHPARPSAGSGPRFTVTVSPGRSSRYARPSRCTRGHSAPMRS